MVRTCCVLFSRSNGSYTWHYRGTKRHSSTASERARGARDRRQQVSVILVMHSSFGIAVLFPVHLVIDSHLDGAQFTD